MNDTDGLGKLVDVQMQAQGVASIRVEDGQLFVFSTETLEKWLEESKAQGKLIVFVRRGAEA